jgi:hypothetical protein
MNYRQMIRYVFAAVLMTLTACGPGEMGPPGPAGPAGADGDPGVGLVSGRLCFGQFTIGSTQVLATHYQYEFSDGATLVSCAVSPSNSPVTDIRSAPIFYKASDTEGATGDCFVNHTVDTAAGRGGGAFYFSIGKKAFQGNVVYKNPGGDFDNTSKPLACSPYP